MAPAAAADVFSTSISTTSWCLQIRHVIALAPSPILDTQHITLTNPSFLHPPASHEIQQTGIDAVINYTTTHFSYPTNYPFESYAARNPVPGTMDNFGNIDNNL